MWRRYYTLLFVDFVARSLFYFLAIQGYSGLRFNLGQYKSIDKTSPQINADVLVRVPWRIKNPQGRTANADDLLARPRIKLMDVLICYAIQS